MAKKQTVGSIVADPGAHDIVTPEYEPQGRPLKLKKVRVHFPAGTKGLLKIRFLYGNTAIIPEKGWITGDDNTFEAEEEFTFDAGSPITIEYLNEDTTDQKVAYYEIVYEVEE
ncbi:MAG: hypothetical protein J7L14_00195 [Candidatus Diapherotrites archaeon]|nr:hypothetical protein [Candidatus Diapherotrites archaeon]